MQVVTFRPGSAPMLNFATELADALGVSDAVAGEEGLDATLRFALARGALEFIEAHLAPNASLLILVDQFEELFAFRGGSADDDAEAVPSETREWQRGTAGDATLRARRRAESADFVDMLLGIAASRELPVFVALTMRSDFLGDCDVFQGLPEAMNDASYLVPRLAREQLRLAIEGPALMAGAEMSSRLLDRLLNDLGDRSDRLPVLQHALHRTFEAWVRGGRVGPIDLRHFEEAGTLEHALDYDAERALASVNAASAERVFRALTDTDVGLRRVRRPCRMNELATTAGIERVEVDQIVAAFRGEDRNFLFVANDGDPRNPRVDISHESLIRQWPRLAAWVDAERRAGTRFRRLTGLARAHRAGERELMAEREFAVQSRIWEEVGATEAWAVRYSAHPDDFDLAQGFVRDSARALEAAREAQARADAELARARARRRRFRVAGTAAVVVVLAGALAFVNRQNRARRQVIADAAAVVGFMSRINAALDTIPGTGDVRRELLRTTEGLTQALSRGAGEQVTVAGTQFWETHQRGDSALQRESRDSARRLYERARDIAVRELAADGGSRVWRRNLSISDATLANMDAEDGRDSLAGARLLRVLAGRQPLAAEDPDDPVAQHDVVTALADLGDFRKGRGDVAGARDYYGRALAVATDLAKRAPDNRERRRDLVALFQSLGLADTSAAGLDSALVWCTKALALADSLLKADPRNPQAVRQVASASTLLGDVDAQRGDTAAARALYTRAVALSERLAVDPGGYLTVSYTKLGGLEQASGHPAQARKWYLEALRLEERLATADSASMVRQRNLAIMYRLLGQQDLDVRNFASARVWFGKALAQAERAARAAPRNTEAQSNVLAVELLLGDASERSCDPKGAEGWWRKALAIALPLARDSTPASLIDLTVVYVDLGDASWEQGNRTAAREWYTQGQATAERLKRAAPDNPLADTEIELARTSLRDLGRVAVKRCP